MRVAIIAKIDKDNESHIGVWKKLQGMVRAYASAGHDVHLYHLQGGRPAVDGKVTGRPLYAISDHHYDQVWIRHHLFGPKLLKEISKYKDAYPSTQIFYEFPTYPYIHEFKGWKKTIAYWHDKLLISRLSHYIYSFAGPNTHANIHSRPYRKMPNRVHVDDYPLIATTKEANLHIIHLLAVGVLWDWYGLDFVIASMQAYTGPYAIHLHIMGRGPEEETLRIQSKQLVAPHKITFYGWSDILKLDPTISTNVIGVGTLAAYRKNLTEVLSLKHREFASCGLPFFYDGRDPDFLEVDWVHTITYDDNGIDLNKLFEWYFHHKAKGSEIKAWSEEHLNWVV